MLTHDAETHPSAREFTVYLGRQNNSMWQQGRPAGCVSGGAPDTEVTRVGRGVWGWQRGLPGVSEAREGAKGKDGPWELARRGREGRQAEAGESITGTGLLGALTESTG